MCPSQVGKSVFWLLCVHVRRVRTCEQHRHQKQFFLHVIALDASTEIPYYRWHASQNWHAVRDFGEHFLPSSIFTYFDPACFSVNLRTVIFSNCKSRCFLPCKLENQTYKTTRLYFGGEKHLNRWLSGSGQQGGCQQIIPHFWMCVCC